MKLNESPYFLSQKYTLCSFVFLSLHTVSMFSSVDFWRSLRTTAKSEVNLGQRGHLPTHTERKKDISGKYCC